MLQQLRDPRVLKYGLWVILILTIPSFVLFYGFGGSPGGGGGNPFTGQAYVTVKTDSGKRELGREELRSARDRLVYEYMFLYYQTRGQEPGDRAMTQIRSGLSNREIAEYAVSMAAFDNLGQEAEIVVTEDQVARRLREQGINNQNFQLILRNNNMREHEFIQAKKFELRNERVQGLIGSLAKVSLLELWLEYKLRNDQLTVDYVRVPVSDYVDDVEVSDAEIQKHYEENLENYVKPEERVFRYVVKAPPKLQEEYQIDEDILRAEYDRIDPAEDSRFREEPGRVVRHIMIEPEEDETLEEARQRAQDVRDRIEVPDQFGIVANQESDDEDTMAGGLLRGRVREENRDQWIDRYGQGWYEAATFYEPNVISDVIESDGRFFILKVDRIATEKIPYDRARTRLEAMVRSQMRQRDEERQRARVMEEQVEVQEVVSTRTSLDSIARELGLDVQVTSPTATTTTNFPGIGNLSAHDSTLANLEEVGNLSPVMRAEGTENLVVMEVTEIIPERYFKLDEVRDRVTNAVRQRKAREKARSLADEVATKVRSGDRMTSAAAELNLAFESISEPFTRMQRPRELMMASDFANVTFRGDVGDVFVLESGFGADFVDSYIAFMITSEQEPDKSEFLDDMQNLERSLRAAKATMLVKEFREDSVDMLEAEFNEDYVNSGGGSRRRGG